MRGQFDTQYKALPVLYSDVCRNCLPSLLCHMYISRHILLYVICLLSCSVFCFLVTVRDGNCILSHILIMYLSLIHI